MSKTLALLLFVFGALTASSRAYAQYAAAPAAPVLALDPNDPDLPSIRHEGVWATVLYIATPVVAVGAFFADLIAIGVGAGFDATPGVVVSSLTGAVFLAVLGIAIGLDLDSSSRYQGLLRQRGLANMRLGGGPGDIGLGLAIDL